jgi:hypothetical protein
MADLEQMKRALVNADAAGDAEAARTLAQAIRSQMAAPAPRANPNSAGFIDDMARSVARGASFGFADEIAAAGDAALGRFVGRGSQAPTLGERYSQNLAAERARDRAFEQSNPVSSFAGEAAGGIAGGLAAFPARVGATALTAIQTAGQGARAGATGGALAGFGSGEGGLENRLEGAATGAALGGTIGGAVPLIATGVGRVGGRVLDAVGLRNPQTGGDRQLLRALERDQAGGGPGIEQVYGRTMSNVGQDARPEFLADMGGENVRRLAAMTTQTPGAARQTAQAAIGERTAGQADRISDDVMRLLSPNSDWHGTVDALQKSRAASAQPLYEAAMSRNAWSPRVDDFINDPIAKQGLARGFQIQRLESVARGEPFDPKQLGVTFRELPNGEFGDPVLVGRPNMRALDMVKAGLDDILEGYRDGVTGKLRLDRTGKAIDEFRRSYIGTLDDLNPDYKAARQAWAGPSQAMDALAKGRNVFRPDDEITAQMVKGMSGADKEMFLAGVSRAIRDRVENSADGRNAVATFFNKQSFRDKLKAAFPNEDAYRRFEGLMQRETGMFEGQRVYGPSAGPSTARNLADAADGMIDPPGGVLSALMTGNIPAAARAGIEGTMRRAQGMNSSTADYLGPIMFNSDQQRNAAQLARLLSQRQQGQRNLANNQALARALLGGTGVAAGAQTD